MRRFNPKWTLFFLGLAFCLIFFLGVIKASDTQIAISRQTATLFLNPNDVYSHIMVKIRPYKSFRLALKLHMDDGEDLWIYYAPTSAEPYQDYEGGPIHASLDADLVDKEWHIIDLNLSLDLESFVVSELRSIREIEILGNRLDLAYIIAYRVLNDGSRSNIIIDDFSLPGQNLSERGWVSSDIKYFTIAFDSAMSGYLKAEYVPPTDDSTEDPNDTEDQSKTYYPYYGYYGGYYGTGYYGSGYYGTGYYGGSYYGTGYYGGGYYGGGYYGGGYYGGGYYGGGLYGGLGGLYGGLYGLSNYYGGPIGALGFGGLGLFGAFI